MTADADAQTAGPAHVATVSFLASRAVPGGGFVVALAGGAALARVGARHGARTGFGASIAAMLETVAIMGPARFGVPLTQAVSAPLLGAIVGDRLRLEITAVRDRDDDVFGRDEIFGAEVLRGRDDLTAPLVPVLRLDRVQRDTEVRSAGAGPRDGRVRATQAHADRVDGWGVDADGRPVLKVRVRARPVEQRSQDSEQGQRLVEQHMVAR